LDLGSVLNNTPWEEYELSGRPVWVKREDLCSAGAGPQFSKVRGLESYLRRLRDNGVKAVGVMDTFHSKAGWGTAWLCQRLGLKCYDFYARYKDDAGVREFQQRARECGAELVEVPNLGRQAVVSHIMRRRLTELDPLAVMLPNGLTVEDAIWENAREVEVFTPPALARTGTWVISVSTGVAAGLTQLMSDVKLIAHKSYSGRSDHKLQETISYFPLFLVDEGYDYRSSVEGYAPFPCNPFYDLKAWEWLRRAIHRLEQPVCFWNIGA
jgi:1-aminocyclopropane-1-carboxylate deaminase/D-cysteine desulfhydrase-like pyridoxal-dependent ACC family enzyme